MASSLPIPAPPRTPTPPSPTPDDQEYSALGIDGVPRTVRSTILFDPSALSPLLDTYPLSGGGRFGSMSSSMNSPASVTTPTYPDGTMGIPMVGGGLEGGSGGSRNPFNFQTQTIKDSPVIAKSVCQTSTTTSSSLSTTLFLLLSGAENELPDFMDFPRIAQTPQRSNAQQARGKYETDVDDCLSPLLSEQAGNVFRRTSFTGFAPSATSPIQKRAADLSIAKQRRGLNTSNLALPLEVNSYAAPCIDLEQQNIGQRRGHRYKHSSVSTQHQVFLEPPQRTPLALPASLPIPTKRELWMSMTREQSIRSCWCICHFLIAPFVNYTAAGCLTVKALSHLIFFDAISASLCVTVDVFHNFEVWKRSSIRHPFGLERAELVIGFSMAILLITEGFNLISHNLKHVLESLGTHVPHHPHSHQRVSPGSVDIAALLCIFATLVSAFGLKNHARIGKAMRFSILSNFPAVLQNPSHALTLSWSIMILFLPFFSLTLYQWLDRLFCNLIGMSMVVLGAKLAIAQALIIMMSYSGNGVSDVIREIANEPQITGIEEAKFWQVHYGLCMACLKLRVRGGMGAGEEVAISKLRDRIALLVRNRLGGGYGKGESMKWEVTVQFSADRDRNS